MAVGNGGFGGSIQGFAEMQTALRLGYATSGNDTGHDNNVDDPTECSRSATPRRSWTSHTVRCTR